MLIIAKIALRNIFYNKKRSFFIGFAIFISTLILLMSYAVLNGVKTQVLRGYVNIQTGHVIVMWNSLINTDHTQPGRFINPVETHSFDLKNGDLNSEAITKLNKFIQANKDKIDKYFPIIRRNAMIINKSKNDTLIVYGLTQEDKKQITESHALKIEEGDLLPSESNSVSISRQKAGEMDLKLGDKVVIEAITVDGKRNSMEFTIRGLYADGADYNNWYGFMSVENARKLYQMKENYFDVVRIFLKDQDEANSFATSIDKYLIENGKLLRAESYLNASSFYTVMPDLMKSIYTVFILFLLSIIAIGLRSIIKMNLFERMKEFGTIRAIGYSKLQTFNIIFFEIMFLSLIALYIALGIDLLFIAIFGKIGIYVGPGDLSTALGDVRFYPKFKFEDYTLAITVITIFSLTVTLSPAIQLCNQKIADIMLKRQKRISIFINILKGVFRSKKGISGYSR